MGHEVFISYAHDDKTTADAICAKLEENKIRCWIAPRDVQPGESFPSAIINAIETSRIMILIFSSKSNNSPHVVRELTKAVSKGVIIIPFRIENILPTKDMEYLISVPHWLDALTPPLENHITELIQVIKKILDKKTEGKPETPLLPGETQPYQKYPTIVHPSQKGTFFRSIMAIVVIVAIVLTLVVSINYFSSHVPTLIPPPSSNSTSDSNSESIQKISSPPLSENLLKGNWTGYYNFFYKSSYSKCDFNYSGKLIWEITSTEGDSFSGNVYYTGIEHKYTDTCTVSSRENAQGTVRGKFFENSLEGLMDQTSAGGYYYMRQFSANFSDEKISGQLFNPSDGIKNGYFTIMKG